MIHRTGCPIAADPRNETCDCANLALTLNLWELMTSAEGHHPLTSKRKEITQTIRELSESSAPGQELSIEASEQGWIIKIFSCYENTFSNPWEIVILVPHSRFIPAQILKDSR